MLLVVVVAAAVMTRIMEEEVEFQPLLPGVPYEPLGAVFTHGLIRIPNWGPAKGLQDLLWINRERFQQAS